MNQTVSGCLYRSPVFAGAALLAALGSGCSPRPPAPARAPSQGAAVADKATCQSRHIKSIWQGEDIAGPECSHFITSGGQAPELSGSRVQTVCERAHIRAILTGEASTPFTQHACSAYAREYPQARTRKTCRAVARAYPRDLNDVQEAMCSQYLDPAGSTRVARNTPRGNAPLPERGSVGTAHWWSFLPPAPSKVAQTATESAPAPHRAASRVSCEDSYIESIWKGRDVSGPECATYVGYDGSTPDYDSGRISSVCLGAKTRALRSDLAMTAFTLQACLRVLQDPWPPEQREPVQITAGAADWNTDVGDPSARRGLSDDAISSTVEANWGSIGRDCLSVVPAVGASGAGSAQSAQSSAAKTPVVVTLTVGASGQVRSVAARATGNRDLEMCIESSVRGWVFPEAVGNTVISLPLVFQGGS